MAISATSAERLPYLIYRACARISYVALCCTVDKVQVASVGMLCTLAGDLPARTPVQRRIHPTPAEEPGLHQEGGLRDAPKAASVETEDGLQLHVSAQPFRYGMQV